MEAIRQTSYYQYLLAVGVAVLLLISLGARAADAPGKATGPDEAAKHQAVVDYGALVYFTYRDSHVGAKALQNAVAALLNAPSEATLAQARQAWIACRVPYSQSEAFRFYGGPIDAVDEKTGKEGPEAQLNAWPLNEAFIDYVKGNDTAGLVHRTDVPLSIEAIASENMKVDESDVTTGYHAVEFLLWGQDFSTTGPGARPATDFLPGDAIRERRRTYLKLATDLIVSDLGLMVSAWEPRKQANNYRGTFTQQPTAVALGQMLSGMATLSGFELASERMATALDSGDQEDEHSCFSDTTHLDFVFNALSIRNAYYGTYGAYQATTSLAMLAKAADPALAAKLDGLFDATDRAIAAIPTPIDAVLASAEGSPERAAMQAAIQALYAETDGLRALGKALGVEVIVAAE